MAAWLARRALARAEQAAALELARQEREELRRKIAQMDEDGAALRAELAELRRQRT